MVYGSYTLTETDTDTEIETRKFYRTGKWADAPLLPEAEENTVFWHPPLNVLGIGLSVCVGQYELAIHHQVYLYSCEHFLTVERSLTGSDTVIVPAVVVNPRATLWQDSES